MTSTYHPCAGLKEAPAAVIIMKTGQNRRNNQRLLMRFLSIYRIIGNARALLFCAPLFFLVEPSLADEAGDNFFDEQVAPLLAARCAECHHEVEPEAELNLLSEATARKGGENGPVLVPGDPGKSLLWKRVAADEMPRRIRLMTRRSRS